MILVTGASGFVGRHLLEALRKRFPEVPIRVLSRAAAAPGIFPDNVEVVCGVLEDLAPGAAVVRGAEVVIHLAAKVQPDPRDSQQMRRVNVQGTRNLYSAAVAAGCRYFLHISSAGVYGRPRGPDPFAEDDARTPVTPYQVTKWEAEKALNEIDPKRTSLNILRPAGIYGSGSYLEIPAYKKILTQRGSIEIPGGVIVHPTHVSDVVEAILMLVGQPAAHKTVFNVGGERPIRVQDLHALIAETLGVRRRRFVLPSPIAGPLGAAAGTFSSIMGRPKPLLASMSKGRLFSVAVDDRLFRQRYPAVPVVRLTDGLKEHIHWARTQRLL